MWKICLKQASHTSCVLLCLSASVSTRTLQHTATQCNTLQHSATLCPSVPVRVYLYCDWADLYGWCRSVLQCVVVCRSVSQCVAVCCSMLQCVAVCRSVSQCVAVSCSVLQCVAVCCHRLHSLNNHKTPWQQQSQDTLYILIKYVTSIT